MSAAVGQAIGSVLIGIGPADALVLAVVALTVSVVAAACYLPDRRLLAGNPLAVLRHE